MPLVDLNKLCPDYAAAVERQDLVRDAAFLGVPETLCGITVAPMTFRHLLWLQMIRSPFIGASSLQEDTAHLDVAAFFKTLAPGDRPSFMNTFTRITRIDANLKQFMAAVGKLKLPAAVVGIRDFVQETFMDAPGGGESNEASYYSIGAALTHRLCAAYAGLNPNPMVYPGALDVPLKAGFQLIKCLKRDENPKAILFNGLSDKAKARWINQQNQPAEDN